MNDRKYSLNWRGKHGHDVLTIQGMLAKLG
jgi:hypothetical protein